MSLALLIILLAPIGLAHEHHALEAHAERRGVGGQDVDDCAVVQAARGVVQLGQGLGELDDVGGGVGGSVRDGARERVDGGGHVCVAVVW